MVIDFVNCIKYLYKRLGFVCYNLLYVSCLCSSGMCILNCCRHIGADPALVRLLQWLALRH